MGIFSLRVDTSEVAALGPDTLIPVLSLPPLTTTGFHPETGPALALVTLSAISTTYDGDGSFQPIAVDLEVDADAGASLGDSAFLAPIMGNLLGADLTKESNYLGGLIGAYSITGAQAATFGTGGVLGIIMDGVTTADACVLGIIDGSDPSSVTTARAVFGVQVNNNDASSGVEYGLDLKSPINPGITDSLQLRIGKALTRSPNDVCWLEGDGAPVDGTTGDNFAGKGSLYSDYTNGEVYIQTGAITNPTWKQITHA